MLDSFTDDNIFNLLSNYVIKHINNKYHIDKYQESPITMYELYFLRRKAIRHTKGHENKDDKVQRLPEYIEARINFDPTIV